MVNYFITSTEEVNIVIVLVCVHVSMCLQNISKSYERILMKFCGEVERGPGRKRLVLGDDSITFANTGSFSRIVFH